MASQVILLVALAAFSITTWNCKGQPPSHSPRHDPFINGSLVRGHVVSVKYEAVIQIDKVLYGEVALVGKRFEVQTGNETGNGVGYVTPVLKVGEMAVWPVDASHGMSKLGSDGLKHFDPNIEAEYNPYGYAFSGHWPLREGDKATYQKAPAMVAVLRYLNARKDWADFNESFPQIIKAGKDPFLAQWEKSFWQSFQSIGD